MRVIGFIGIFLLALINVFGLVVACQKADWGGVALMACLAGMLAWFARVLWRGRRLERDARAAPLADGWHGASVTHFFRDQVARSPEGLILIAGSCAALILGVVALCMPAALGLPAGGGGKAAAVWMLWPVAAFVWYVRLCGPAFGSSIYKTLVMAAVMCAPLAIVYRW